jgi:hypothetical protein
MRANSAFRKYTAIIGAVLIVLLAGTELSLRIFMGQPALYVADAEIEYMFQPDQRVHRFGREVKINAYGMRSEDLVSADAAGRFRVLVLGDSVVNGGNLTDQSALATDMLSRQQTSAGEPIDALNVSAGSWGPGNLLAYINRFGTFDADMAILVLSRHDLDDDRTFAPLDKNTYPTAAPMFATQEFLDRYVQRYLPFKWSSPPSSGGAALAGDAETLVPVLLDRLAALPGGACLILHYETGEQDSEPAEMQKLASLAEARGIQVVDDRVFMSAASFRDEIHLNDAGQRGLLEAMHQCTNLPAVLESP